MESFRSKTELSMYIGLVAVVAVMMAPVYADQVVQPTSGGTINVGFETDPSNPTPGGQTNLQISFLNKSTHASQDHVDYKISVMEGSNQICGTPPLHKGTEPTITFPCVLPDAATYQVIVEVDGILFQPIPPETTTFTVNLGTTGTNQNSSSTAQPSNNLSIPSWVKTTAGWWSNGQVGDQDFVKGIQYLIQQGIMQIPTQTNSSSTSSTQQIPSWVKTTAGWWSNGQVGDQDFVKGIQWLISNGIITV